MLNGNIYSKIVHPCPRISHWLSVAATNHHYYNGQPNSADLLSAAAAGQRARVERLLASGANTNYRDQADFTALHYAVQSAFEDIVRVLIENGADVNAQDTDTASTPLHLAATGGYTRIAALLLDSRADTMLRDSKQDLAIDKARKSGHGAIVAILEHSSRRTRTTNSGPGEKSSAPSISPRLEDNFIAIMGMPRSEKPTFISHFTNGAIGNTCSEDLTTPDVKVHTGTHRGREIQLCDFPSNFLNAEAFRAIASFLAAESKLAGVIWLQSIDYGHHSDGLLDNLAVFRSIWGEENFKSIILVPVCSRDADDNRTMSEVLEQEEARIAEFRENDEVWGKLVRSRSRIVQYYGTALSAHDIVDSVLSRPANCIRSTAIRKELVDEGMSLNETSAGKFLMTKLDGERREYEARLAALR